MKELFKGKRLSTLHLMIEMLFFTSEERYKGTHYGLFKICHEAPAFIWTMFILDLTIHYTNKVLVLRWVLTVLSCSQFILVLL